MSKTKIYLYETGAGFFYWNYGIKEDWLINSSDFDYINKVTEELNKRTSENMVQNGRTLGKWDIIDVIYDFAEERALRYDALEFNEGRLKNENENEDK